MSTRSYKSSTITVAAAVVVQASLKSRTSSNRAPKEPGSQPRAHKPPPVQIPKHPERDADFWYSDGNIVIRVEARLFKVHRSRLSKHCAYFRKLFAAEMDATLSAKGGMVDSCPVHRLPTNLSASAFKQFLIALETPLAFVKNPPSEADAYAMLKASHTLSCPVIFNLAKDRLAQI